MRNRDKLVGGFASFGFIMGLFLLAFSALRPRLLERNLGVPDLIPASVFLVSLNILTLTYAYHEFEQAESKLSGARRNSFLALSVIASSGLGILLPFVPPYALPIGMIALLISMLALVTWTGFLTLLRGHTRRYWVLTFATFLATVLVLALGLFAGLALRYLAILVGLGLALIARQVAISADKTAYRAAFVAGIPAGVILFLSIVELLR